MSNDLEEEKQDRDCIFAEPLFTGFSCTRIFQVIIDELAM
jgi:hypothetical protein